MAPSTARAGLLSPEFLRQLERMTIAAKRVRMGITKGERKSRRRGSSTDFADYRDYVQGDDLRHIDWNIYGRLSELYIKLFEEREDLTLHLLIDASQSMNFGTPTKLHFAQKLAAALGYIALSGEERVSAESFSSEGYRKLAPCRAKSSVRKFFTFLEGIEAGGGTRLEDSCKGYMARNRSKGVSLIISDFFDEAGPDSAIKRLNQSGGDLYAIHVLAPEEIEPNLAGDLKLIDSENDTFAEISVTPVLLKRYRKNRDAFCESVRRFCTARGVGYAAVSSDAAIEQVVLSLLRRGGMVQ